MSVRVDAADSFTRSSNLPSISAFTVMGWCYQTVNRNNYSNVIAVLPSNAIQASHFVFSTTVDGTTYAAYLDSANLGTITAPGLNTWFCWYIRGNGTTMDCGLRTATQSSFTRLSGTRTSWSLGFMELANNPWGEVYDGRFAAIKMWDAALTDAEIDTEMWSVIPQRWSNLNAYYPFFASGQLEDWSGNGRNWTVSGTQTTEDGPPIAIFPPWWETATWHGAFTAASRTFILTAEPGSYAVTGTNAALLLARLLSADAGVYAVSGQTVNLLRNYILTADSGSYVVNGTAANFLRTYLLNAEAGVYTIQGQTAELVYSAAPLPTGDFLIFLRRRRRYE